MSFHNEIQVKRTRRTRRCDWCGELMQKGDPSVSTSGIFEGDFYQGRYHPECNDAIARWWKKYGHHGDEFPDWTMNRGGVEEKGEPETEVTSPASSIPEHNGASSLPPHDPA